MALFSKTVTVDAPNIDKANAAAEDLQNEISSTQNWIAEQIQSFNDGKVARAKRLREAGERAAAAVEGLELTVKQ